MSKTAKHKIRNAIRRRRRIHLVLGIGGMLTAILLAPTAQLSPIAGGAIHSAMAQMFGLRPAPEFLRLRETAPLLSDEQQEDARRQRLSQMDAAYERHLAKRSSTNSKGDPRLRSDAASAGVAPQPPRDPAPAPDAPDLARNDVTAD